MSWSKKLLYKGTFDSFSIDSSSNARVYAAIKLTSVASTTEEEKASKASFVLESGNIKGYYYGISGNGNTGRGNTEIEITGGSVQGHATNDNAGIYHPQNGMLTINGGTILGASAADNAFMSLI